MSMRQAVEQFLTEPVRARLSDPTPTAIGMPGAIYTDPGFFDLERKLTFSRNWVCAGVTSDIPNPGDQMPFDLAGMPILLVRDGLGEIRAFHNICRHRGVLLVSEKLNRPNVLCPYHAWSYTLDGALSRTPGFCGPGVNTHEAFDPTAHGLLPVRCELFGPGIFINLWTDAPPLSAVMGTIAARWRDYDFSTLRSGGGLRFALKANWKLVIENFVERYHLPFVHPTLNQVSSIKHTLHIMDGERYVGVGSRNFDPPPVDPDHLLPIFPGLTGDRLRLAEYIAVFPNVMIGVHYNHVYFFILEPRGVDLTVERFEFFFIGDEALDPAYSASRQQMIDLIQLVNGEDINIVQQLHQGCVSPAMQGSVFSPVFEDTTHKFQRIVVDRLLADADAADAK
jgi:choline monooxygenase